MKWTSIKSEIATITLKKAAHDWSFVELSSLVSDAQNYPLILYPNPIRKKIMKHVREQNVELGGLLVGSIVSITDSVEEIILSLGYRLRDNSSNLIMSSAKRLVDALIN